MLRPRRAPSIRGSEITFSDSSHSGSTSAPAATSSAATSRCRPWFPAGGLCQPFTAHPNGEDLYFSSLRMSAFARDGSSERSWRRAPKSPGRSGVDAFARNCCFPNRWSLPLLRRVRRRPGLLAHQKLGINHDLMRGGGGPAGLRNQAAGNDVTDKLARDVQRRQSRIAYWGTRAPRSRSSRSAPTAMMSLTQMIAVG